MRNIPSTGWTSGITVFSLIAFCFLLMGACNSETATHSYQEKNAPRAEPAAASATPRPLPRGTTEAAGNFAWHWQTPAGWHETSTEGIRLAAFAIGPGPVQARCTIVPLPGDGGGLPANIARWRQQLGLPALVPAALDTFISGQKSFTTNQGDKAVLVDFTAAEAACGSSSGLSLIVAVIQAKTETLFLKMSGTAATLAANREALLQLCQSLRHGT